MAGHGPAPKDPSKRVRRNAEPMPRVTLEADGQRRGPTLPPAAKVLPVDPDLADGVEWHPRTRAWWNTWRKSAQGQVCTPTDWDFLIDTALLHHSMWADGRWQLAAEIRLRVAKYGATPEDRMRLRMQIEMPSDQAPTPDKPDAGSVTDIASRRARLSE